MERTGWLAGVLALPSPYLWQRGGAGPRASGRDGRMLTGPGRVRPARRRMPRSSRRRRVSGRLPASSPCGGRSARERGREGGGRSPFRMTRGMCSVAWPGPPAGHRSDPGAGESRHGHRGRSPRAHAGHGNLGQVHRPRSAAARPRLGGGMRSIRMSSSSTLRAVSGGSGGRGPGVGRRTGTPDPGPGSRLQTPPQTSHPQGGRPRGYRAPARSGLRPSSGARPSSRSASTSSIRASPSASPISISSRR